MQNPDTSIELPQFFENVQKDCTALFRGEGQSSPHITPLPPVKILVLEDNMLIAAQLAQDLAAAGHHILGPFNDIAAAEQMLDQAQAAILDVRIGRSTSFALAQHFKFSLQPIVFYTGLSDVTLPEALHDIPVVSKPAPVVDLLQRLALQRRQGSTADLIRDFIPVLQARALQIHHDRAGADRLVEAALRAALHHAHEISRDEICDWLLHCLDNQPLRHFPRLLI